MVYASRSKGAPGFNEVEDEMRKAYINAKKSEMIIKDFGDNSIQDISKNLNIKIQSASVSLKSLNNIDAEVIGSLFSAKNNKENVSLPPLVGKNGVYKIFMKTTAVPVEKKSYQVEKDAMSPKILIRTPLGGFINHSDTPNCERVKSKPDGNIFSWTLKTTDKIEPGQELTLKYSMYRP